MSNFADALKAHLESLPHLGLSERLALRAASNPFVPRHARALAEAEKEATEKAGLEGFIDWFKNFDWAKWLPVILSVIGFFLMFLAKPPVMGATSALDEVGLPDGSWIIGKVLDSYVLPPIRVVVKDVQDRMVGLPLSLAYNETDCRQYILDAYHKGQQA